MWALRRNWSLVRCYSTTVTNAVEKHAGWESVVGLEVHAQIQANSKLFSPASAQFGAPVNSLVSLLDASVPGTLPVLNRQCVEAAVATATALSCRVNMTSTFDRKHYFYSDLPAGYQITQQRKAIAEYGKMNFLVIMPDGKTKPYYKSCRIRQIQLEQDSGKSLHDEELDRSLIDLNRAGIALMEIVFQPDLANGEEAAALVKELCLILQILNTCSCRMEEGALRVDANISVNRKGDPLGIRTEIKNLSSLRSLVGAIEFEIERQIEVLEAGGRVTNETRSFDADRKMTLPMRDKEVQQDYRFMPEPNLPPLRLYEDTSDLNDSVPNQVNIARIKSAIFELPETVRQNFVKKFNLRMETAHVIVNTVGCTQYFKAVMNHIPAEYGVRAANVLLTEVMEELHDRDLSFENLVIEPKTIADVISLIESGKIHVSTAKSVLHLLFNGDKRVPNQIVEEEGWLQVSDDSIIHAACVRVIEENAKLVQNYKSTKKSKHLNKLIALVKENSREKIDMKKVSETVLKLINEK